MRSGRIMDTRAETKWCVPRVQLVQPRHYHPLGVLAEATLLVIRTYAEPQVRNEFVSGQDRSISRYRTQSVATIRTKLKMRLFSYKLTIRMLIIYNPTESEAEAWIFFVKGWEKTSCFSGFLTAFGDRIALIWGS